VPVTKKPVEHRPAGLAFPVSRGDVRPMDRGPDNSDGPQHIRNLRGLVENLPQDWRLDAGRTGANATGAPAGRPAPPMNGALLHESRRRAALCDGLRQGLGPRLADTRRRTRPPRGANRSPGPCRCAGCAARSRRPPRWSARARSPPGAPLRSARGT